MGVQMSSAFFTETKREILNEIGGEEKLEEYKFKHPKELRMSLWVWLHPSAYSLIHWGIPGCFLFQGAVFNLIHLFVFSWSPLLWVAVGMYVVGLYSLWKQKNSWLFRKGSTLYEIYLQNY